MFGKKQPKDGNADVVTERKPKKPLHKRLWFWVIIVAVIFIAVNSGGSKPEDSASGEVVEPSDASETQPTEEPAPVEAEPEPEISTEETLSMFFSETNHLKTENLTIWMNETGTLCNVSYTDTGSHWNETSALRDEMSAFIKFCRKAFDLEGLEEVWWSVDVAMIDARGNSSVENAFQFDMMKDKFDLYDWDNMGYRKGIYTQFSSDCVKFWVRSSIMNRIDTADIYYID